MNDPGAMANPTLSEGDGGGDLPEIEVEVEPESTDYPWAEDKDQMLRSFIFQTLADSNTSVLPSIEHMDACYAWIKDRDLPPEGKKSRAKHLKSVDA